MKEVCGNCRFWVLAPHGEAGDCRRRAPMHVMGTLNLGPVAERETEEALIAYWPNTGETEWCGEHEAQP